MNKKRSTKQLIERSLGILKKDYIIIGKERVPSRIAWIIIGVTAGLTVAIAFLASRSGTFEESQAAATTAPVHIWLEAEWGTIAGPMASSTDPEASNKKFVWTPKGTGHIYDPAKSKGQAIYTFFVPKSDDYLIWGRVAFPGPGNSFFASVDGGPWANWDIPLESTSWRWDRVANRIGSDRKDPIIYTLSAGIHTLIIKQREDGTKLDKLLITNDNFYPKGLGEVVNLPVPPAVSLTAPAEGATLSGTVTIAADASDDVGVAGVLFKVDNTAIGSEDTVAPYRVSWDTTSVANGSYSLIAIARDTGGNVSTLSPIQVTVLNMPPLIIHMSPAGDDARSGLTPSEAVGTLSRVQDIIRTELPDKNKDVEVHIASGTYQNDSVIWKYTMPTHSITFRQAMGAATKPVFDACTQGSATNCAKSFFTLQQSSGEPSNLIFRNLIIRNYQGHAVSFNGNRNLVAGWNGNNRIYGCSFKNVGKDSTAIVRFINSDNNIVRNNSFNDGPGTSALHAIYIAHDSDNTQILNNRFARISGDPVRIRDASDNTLVQNNTLLRSGNNAAISLWFCDKTIRTDCTKEGAECPNAGTVVQSNTWDAGYNCEDIPVARDVQPNPGPFSCPVVPSPRIDIKNIKNNVKEEGCSNN